MKNPEEASAGGILTLVTVFLLAGTLFVLIGFGVDKFTVLSAQLYTGAATSQMRFDTVSLMIMAMRAEPLLLLLGLGINHWVNASRQYSGIISLGTLLVGAAEMILSTLAIIAFTLFGGGALDAVIFFVNNWEVPGTVQDLFSAIQFIGPAFYGICFLILIAIIVQFFALCVQTVDYTQQTGYSTY